MVRVFAVAFVLVLSVRVAHGQTPSVCGARDNGIIANPHAITYPRLPTQWAECLPLGNGEIGVMCWSDGRRLRFTFDSAGAWVLRHKSGELDYSQLTYAKLRQWVSAGNFDAIREAAERMGERDRLRPTKLYLWADWSLTVNSSRIPSCRFVWAMRPCAVCFEARPQATSSTRSCAARGTFSVFGSIPGRTACN